MSDSDIRAAVVCIVIAALVTLGLFAATQKRNSGVTELFAETEAMYTSLQVPTGAYERAFAPIARHCDGDIERLARRIAVKYGAFRSNNPRKYLIDLVSKVSASINTFYAASGTTLDNKLCESIIDLKGAAIY